MEITLVCKGEEGGEERRRREEEEKRGGTQLYSLLYFFCHLKTLNELFNPTVAVIMVTESFRSDW